ncbi:peptidyl-prolyl cis-trans isomerase CYP95-like isoform X1 [Canna indica]|uniref:Peptidyl-prolyl cis-trans isomerase CYP95-like isoform X1 n=1 Tax=Canna indica TaxID=4628 RepID=A0AAQ3QMV9_9LILI|nr:peptidyl-prolyl cis-trans isomerase CYP95-like isoform X1 [Canna indica]
MAKSVAANSLQRDLQRRRLPSLDSSRHSPLSDSTPNRSATTASGSGDTARLRPRRLRTSARLPSPALSDSARLSVSGLPPPALGDSERLPPPALGDCEWRLGRLQLPHSPFPDDFVNENSRHQHNEPGHLFRSTDCNDNFTSFIITLKANVGLDRDHVVFGKMMHGMDILHIMKDVGQVLPLVPVIIVDCGVVTKEVETMDMHVDNDGLKCVVFVHRLFPSYWT